MGQFESDVGNMVKFSYQNIKHITLICQHDKLHLVCNFKFVGWNLVSNEKEFSKSHLLNGAIQQKSRISINRECNFINLYILMKINYNTLL